MIGAMRSGRWRHGDFAVDQPGDAEAIDDHAEARGPEGLLERHDDLAVLREVAEDALGGGDARELERQREAFRFLVAAWRDVAAHQRLTGDGHAAVHDLVL